jgi:hypothetical protein
MSDKDTGGPAFPADPFIASNPENVSVAKRIAEGMTLRDYFAAKALCGIEASQGNNGEFITTVELVAERAYQLADAMLEARK